MEGLTQLAPRVAILAAVVLAAILAVSLTRRYVARQRRLALAPYSEIDGARPLSHGSDGPGGVSAPRILAFSSPYCSPCHTLQEPALRRVAEDLGGGVAIETVDATEHAELAARYHVMTLPATVVFDAAGHPSAVNYGYADAKTLLAQLGEASSCSVCAAG